MTNSIEKRGPANLSGSVFAIYRRDGKGQFSLQSLLTRKHVPRTKTDLNFCSEKQFAFVSSVLYQTEKFMGEVWIIEKAGLTSPESPLELK